MRILALSLLLAASSAQALCLHIHGDSDGNTTVNINEVNYVKAKLGMSDVPADVAASDTNACDGTVNINDLNQIKVWQGVTVTWKTVGGATYSDLCDTCDNWSAMNSWLNTYGNTQLGNNVAADQTCVPLTYAPNNRVYSPNTGAGHPSSPTIDLRNWFWGTSTATSPAGYYTYCYASW